MTRTLRDVMDSESALAAVQTYARRLRMVQAALCPLLPLSMREEVRVGQLRDGRLVLRTRSNAVAAKLRQMGEGLKAGLGTAGVIVEEVRVVVKPVPVAAERGREVAPQVLAGRGRAAVQRLASSLPEGDGLRRALEGLLAVSARRAGAPSENEQ